MTADSTRRFPPLHIRIVPGVLAPRYEDGTAADLEQATITEQGMASGLPLVDLHCRDGNGHEIIVVTTGKLLLSLAAAIRGVNLRNHGVEEP